MKLIIKTKSLELEYEDNYQKIEHEAKERLLDLVKTVLEQESKMQTKNNEKETSKDKESARYPSR